MYAYYLAWYMECLVNEWINTYTKKKNTNKYSVWYTNMMFYYILNM